MGIEQQWRGERDDRVGDQCRRRAIAPVASGKPQERPGQGRREHRHDNERTARAAETIGRRQDQRQKGIVARVLLAVTADGISGLWRESPADDRQRITGLVVIR